MTRSSAVLDSRLRDVILNAILALASGLSALWFVSGIVWYPLFALLFTNALVFILIVIAAVWFGAKQSDPHRSLALGNVAVLAGLISFIELLHIALSNQVGPGFFLAASAVLVAGYGALVGSLFRLVINLLGRRR